VEWHSKAGKAGRAEVGLARPGQDRIGKAGEARTATRDEAWHEEARLGRQKGEIWNSFTEGFRYQDFRLT
jgi:hypothetical protein